MRNPTATRRYFAGFALTASIAAISATAHATGVDAGTLIQNTASATYTSGSVNGSIQSNTVTVKVDELLNVAVAGLTTTPIAVGSGTAVLEYTITNTGNGPEAFVLSANPAVTGNAFNSVVQSIAIDSNGNGSYDSGVDQIVATGGSTPVMTADTTLKAFVVVTLPNGANDGDTSQVRLIADAVTGTGTPGTTFAGQGQGGSDAVVGVTGATSNALDLLRASLATVSLVKSAAIADPFGGTKSVPGAIITYTLVATVSGSGSANGLHVTDATPTGTTYQAGSIKLDGTPLTDAADADAGLGSASGIDVTLGTLAGGTTKTVTFNVKIN